MIILFKIGFNEKHLLVIKILHQKVMVSAIK